MLEPFALRADEKRLRALYRTRGYYRAEVHGAVAMRPGGDVADVTFTIDEGSPVIVQDVELEVTGVELSADQHTQLRAEFR